VGTPAGSRITPAALAEWVLARPPAPALPAGPRVVAVDGRSGAGKSTLARSLADAVRRLRAGAVVVRLDDLYPGWDGLDPVVPLVVEHLLTPLAGARPIVVPTWDWDGDRPGRARPVSALGPPRPAVVLLEGAGSGARAAAPWLAGVVWVDAEPAARRARALARDGDTYAPHWDRWSAQEEVYARREHLPARAALVLDTSGEGPVVVR
jgi:energy-coupling factor transporter ATP-binding protein EcfA2